MAARDSGGAVVNPQQGTTETVRVARVSAGYFQIPGAKLAPGRGFLSEEDRHGGPRVAVISEHLWKRRFAADRFITNRSIQLEDGAYRVIGVLAPAFPMNPSADVWLPLHADPASVDHVNRVQVLARLKPAVTSRQAQSDVRETMTAFLRKLPRVSGIAAPLIPLEVFTAIPLRDAVVGGIRPRVVFADRFSWFRAIAGMRERRESVSRARKPEDRRVRSTRCPWCSKDSDHLAAA